MWSHLLVTEDTWRIDNLLKSDPLRWPLITAAEKTVAYATKIEWLLETATTCESCGHPQAKREAEFNFMQIFRTPFYLRLTKMTPALELHLDQIESALRDGIRKSYEPSRPYSTLGGVKQLLGRWPRKDDELMLRILRPTTLVQNENTYEWVTELSLQARAGLL